MSKRRSQGKELKSVGWDEITRRLEGECVVVAVDVAKEDFVGAVLDGEQTALLTFKWRHPQETAEVVERICELGQGRQLEAVLEPCGTYGDALVGQLRQAGVALNRVSPKRVHDAAAVCDGGPSLRDAKAAYLIGRLHRQGISQPWQEPSEEGRELKAIQTRLRLEAHLSRHRPEILCLLPLGSVTLAALIGAYGDPACVAADPGGAEALLRRSGRPGLSEEKIQAVLASAQSSLGVDEDNDHDRLSATQCGHDQGFSGADLRPNLGSPCRSHPGHEAAPGMAHGLLAQ
jgi:hypothetical protein